MSAGLGLYLIGAVLLVVAGGSKVFRPRDTARALASTAQFLSPRTWVSVVRCLALVEAGIGAWALIRTGAAPAAAVSVSYLGFTALVIIGRRLNTPLATCGCFGKADTPPTRTHAVITLAVGIGAAMWAFSDHSVWITDTVSRQPWEGIPLLAGIAMATWLAYLAMVPLARLGALRADPPYLPTGGRV